MIDFVLSFNPIWSLVDLNGVQFDDTFYMWVLENEIPYIPAPVYHTQTGTPWDNPIQFLSNGTLPVEIYWDPTIVYRLEIRQAVGLNPPSQSDPLIYLVPNYVPDGTGGNEPSTVDDTLTENQITNGQFSIVNFAQPYVLTSVNNPPSIAIGPGWFLDLVGTGSVTITQVPLSDTLPNPTNAPYAIRITLTGGWTSPPVLRQTFEQNGMLWAGKYVASSVTALISGNSQNMSAQLQASNGQTLATLQNITLTNTFTEYNGFALLPATMNPNIPPNASISYRLLLPTVCDVFLTSFQLVASNTAANFEYEQDTINRQIDHTFNYYQPLLAYKPINSYLFGWDFPLNPAQFGVNQGPFNDGVNTAEYVWDQTIVFQTANNGYTVQRSTSGSLLITAQQTGQVAVIQYLGQTEARKILSDRASVHMNMHGTIAGGMNGNVTLWASTNANAPVLPDIFFDGLDAAGVPTTIDAGWVQVPNVYQNTFFTVPLVSPTNAESNDINLNGWDQAGATPVNTATYFAIVIGFTEWHNTDFVVINSVGLCAGDIATRPAPKTLDQTLSDCERYYEMSYQLGNVAGDTTTTNQLTAPMFSSFLITSGMNIYGFFIEQSFGFVYRNQKRIPLTQGYPNVTLYSPFDGTSGAVYANYIGQADHAANDLITQWGTPVIGDKAAYFPATGSSTPSFANVLLRNDQYPLICWINYHYVVDAQSAL